MPDVDLVRKEPVGGASAVEMRGNSEASADNFLSQAVPRYVSWLKLFDSDERWTGKYSIAGNKYVNEFSEMTDEIIKKGQHVEGESGDIQIIRRVKAQFRDLLAPWYLTNPFMKRCLDRPRGIPGDYMTLEMIYTYRAELGRKLGGYFDRYLLEHASCVRSRKEKMKEVLSGSVGCGGRNKLTREVLSLGSGPCREWVELASNRNKKDLAWKNGVHLTCLDRDPMALGHVASELRKGSILKDIAPVEARLPHFGRLEEARDGIGKFELVYAIGISDYFLDQTLSKIISKAFSLVSVGGTLLMTHKDRTRFTVSAADWLCDWKFVKRSELEFTNLIGNVLREKGFRYEMWVERDESEKIIFGFVRKIK